MAMQNPNRRLISIVAMGWLASVGVGLGLRQVSGGATITVVIDRSYCDPSLWRQQVATPYANLYAQAEQRRLTIEQVVYVSDLGTVVAEELPPPTEVEALVTFGRFNGDRLQQAMTTYPSVTVLSCNQNS